MKKYIKNVFVNGEQKYGVNVEKSAEEMVRSLAQWHFLKQSGEDITVDQKVNEKYEAVQYIMTRKLNGQTIVHTYDVVDC